MEINRYSIEGQAFYPAIDVGTALGFKNTRQAVSSHCQKQGVCKETIIRRGRRREMLLINEVNFWLLVFASKSALGHKLRLEYLRSKPIPPETLISQIHEN